MRKELVSFMVGLGLFSLTSTSKVSAQTTNNSAIKYENIIYHPTSDDAHESIPLNPEYAPGLQELYNAERAKLNLPPDTLYITRDRDAAGECKLETSHVSNGQDSIRYKTVVSPNFLINFSERLDVLLSHEIGHEIEQREIIKDGGTLADIFRPKNFTENLAEERYADSISIAVHGVEKFSSAINDFSIYDKFTYTLDLKNFAQDCQYVSQNPDGLYVVDWDALLTDYSSIDAYNQTANKNYLPWLTVMETISNFPEELGGPENLNSNHLISTLYDWKQIEAQKKDYHQSYANRVKQGERTCNHNHPHSYTGAKFENHAMKHINNDGNTHKGQKR